MESVAPILKPYVAKPKPPKPKTRCLGPGPEHFFLSTNRKKHRICEPCMSRLKRMSKIATEGEGR